MIVTQEAAMNMLCPIQLAGSTSLKCKGARCMCWEWERKPFLSKCIIKEIEENDSIPGEDWMGAAKRILAAWNPPQLEGWKYTGKGTDENDYILYAEYERDQDPDASGYCGLTRKGSL